MPINHTKIHYALAAVAISLGGYGAVQSTIKPDLAAIHGPAKAGRHDWKALGEDKTTALGDTLKAFKPEKVTIYCAASSCHQLRADLDDAMQLAGWPSEFEDRPVDSESDAGVFVGPPGDKAEGLVAALAKIGIDTKIVPIEGIDGLGIIIGKVQ